MMKCDSVNYCLYLALLAIFIASIGLLGLSSFLAEQRIKEIGIRKAMGDTTTGIIRLFSTEFVKWVVLSGTYCHTRSCYYT